MQRLIRMFTEQDVFVRHVCLSGAIKSKPGKMTKSFIFVNTPGTRDVTVVSNIALYELTPTVLI